MQYEDSNPENQPFVDEIRGQDNLANLHSHLPKGFYRECKDGDYPRRYAKLWGSIDAFVEAERFDVDEFWRVYREGDNAKEKRDESQIMLCPLYIHLRKQGFESEFFQS